MESTSFSDSGKLIDTLFHSLSGVSSSVIPELQKSSELVTTFQHKLELLEGDLTEKFSNRENELRLLKEAVRLLSVSENDRNVLEKKLSDLTSDYSRRSAMMQNEIRSKESAIKVYAERVFFLEGEVQVQEAFCGLDSTLRRCLEGVGTLDPNALREIEQMKSEVHRLSDLYEHLAAEFECIQDDLVASKLPGSSNFTDSDDFVPSPRTPIAVTPAAVRSTQSQPRQLPQQQRRGRGINTPTTPFAAVAISEPKEEIVAAVRMQYLEAENEKLSRALNSALQDLNTRISDAQLALTGEAQSICDEFEQISSEKDVVCVELENAVNNLHAQLLSSAQEIEQLSKTNSSLADALHDVQNELQLVNNTCVELRAVEDDLSSKLLRKEKDFDEVVADFGTACENLDKEKKLSMTLKGKLNDANHQLQLAQEQLRTRELDHCIQVHNLQQEMDKIVAQSRNSVVDNSRMTELVENMKLKLNNALAELRSAKEQAKDREGELIIQCETAQSLMSRKCIELEQVLLQLDWERNNSMEMETALNVLSQSNSQLRIEQQNLINENCRLVATTAEQESDIQSLKTVVAELKEKLAVSNRSRHVLANELAVAMDSISSHARCLDSIDHQLAGFHQFVQKNISLGVNTAPAADASNFYSRNSSNVSLQLVAAGNRFDEDSVLDGTLALLSAKSNASFASSGSPDVSPMLQKPVCNSGSSIDLDAVQYRVSELRSLVMRTRQESRDSRAQSARLTTDVERVHTATALLVQRAEEVLGEVQGLLKLPLSAAASVSARNSTNNSNNSYDAILVTPYHSAIISLENVVVPHLQSLVKDLRNLQRDSGSPDAAQQFAEYRTQLDDRIAQLGADVAALRLYFVENLESDCMQSNTNNSSSKGLIELRLVTEDKLDGLMSELSSLTATVQRLSELSEEMSAELSSLSEEKSALQVTVSQLTDSLLRTDNKNVQLTERNVLLESENAQVVNIKSVFLTQLETLTAERDRLERSHKLLSESCTSLSAVNKANATQVIELTASRDRLIGELAADREALAAVNSKCSELTEQIASITSSAEAAKQSLEQQLAVIEKERASLTESVSTLQTDNEAWIEEVDELEAERDALVKQAEERQRAFDGLNEALAAQSAASQQLEVHLQAAESAKADLLQQVQHDQVQIDQLSAQLEAEVATVNEQREQIDLLNKQIVSFEEDLDGYVEEIEELEQQLEVVTKEVALQKEQLESCRHKCGLISVAAKETIAVLPQILSAINNNSVDANSVPENMEDDESASDIVNGLSHARGAMVAAVERMLELNETSSDLRTESVRVRSDMEALRENNELMLKQMEHMAREKVSAGVVLEALQASNAQLLTRVGDAEQLAQLRQSSEARAAEALADCLQELRLSQQQNAQMTVSLAALVESKAAIDAELQQLQATSERERCAKDEAMGSLQRALEERRAQLESERERNDALLQELEQLHEVVATLRTNEKQSSEAMRELRQLSDIEREQLREVTAKADALLAKISEREIEIADMTSKLQSSENELAIVRDANSDLQSTVNSLSSELSVLNAKLRQSQDTISSQNCAIDELSISATTLQSELAAAKDEINRLSECNGSLQQLEVGLKARNEAQQAEIEQLLAEQSIQSEKENAHRNVAQALSEEREERGRLSAQLEQLRQQLTEESERCSRLSGELAKERESVASLASDKAVAARVLEALREERELLTRANEELTVSASARAEAESVLRAELADWRGQFEMLASRCAELSTSSAAVKQINEYLTVDSERFQEEISQINEEAESLRVLNEKLSEENERLRSGLESFDVALKAQMDHLQSDTDAWSKSVELLETQKDALAATAEQLRKENAQLSGQIDAIAIEKTQLVCELDELKSVSSETLKAETYKTESLQCTIVELLDELRQARQQLFHSDGSGDANANAKATANVGPHNRHLSGPLSQALFDFFHEAQQSNDDLVDKVEMLEKERLALALTYKALLADYDTLKLERAVIVETIESSIGLLLPAIDDAEGGKGTSFLSVFTSEVNENASDSSEAAGLPWLSEETKQKLSTEAVVSVESSNANANAGSGIISSEVGAICLKLWRMCSLCSNAESGSRRLRNAKSATSGGEEALAELLSERDQAIRDLTCTVEVLSSKLELLTQVEAMYSQTGACSVEQLDQQQQQQQQQQLVIGDVASLLVQLSACKVEQAASRHELALAKQELNRMCKRIAMGFKSKQCA